MPDSYPAWNLDNLSEHTKALLAYAFSALHVGWTLCYMIEVRLDDPDRHILQGGDGFVSHGGNGSACYAHHVGDEDWAVIHCDSEAWKAIGPEQLIERGREAAAYT